MPLEHTCPECLSELKWDRAIGLDKCESCGERLPASSGKLPEGYRDTADELADLISPDPTKRAKTLKLLPPPFRDWEAGDVFAATVELATLWANIYEPSGRLTWSSLARGDFSGLGSAGIFEGYNLISSWPSSIENFIRGAVSSLDQTTAQNRCVEIIERYGSTRLKQTKVINFLNKRLREAFRNSGITFKSSHNLDPATRLTQQAITQTDATNQFGLSNVALRRLADVNVGVVGRDNRFRGIILYEKAAVKEAADVHKSSVRGAEAAKLIGCPDFMVGTLAECGVLETVRSEVATIAAGSLLYRIPTLDGFLSSADTHGCFDDKPEALASVLKHQLSPRSWATCLLAVSSRRIHARIGQSDNDVISEMLLVDRDEVIELCSSGDAEEHQTLVSAATAGVILGVADHVLTSAKRFGLIEELTVSNLIEFRNRFVFPKEIAVWYSHNSIVFRNTMDSRGFSPIADLSHSNVWTRAHVEQVYPESANVRFYREWCQSS